MNERCARSLAGGCSTSGRGVVQHHTAPRGRALTGAQARSRASGRRLGVVVRAAAVTVDRCGGPVPPPLLPPGPDRRVLCLPVLLPAAACLLCAHRGQHASPLHALCCWHVPSEHQERSNAA